MCISRDFILCISVEPLYCVYRLCISCEYKYITHTLCCYCVVLCSPFSLKAHPKSLTSLVESWTGEIHQMPAASDSPFLLLTHTAQTHALHRLWNNTLFSLSLFPPVLHECVCVCVCVWVRVCVNRTQCDACTKQFTYRYTYTDSMHKQRTVVL